ncbi:hypothetical protein OAF54_03110 [bacterium]|nr:hypothetical protein [bacterium]
MDYRPKKSCASYSAANQAYHIDSHPEHVQNKNVIIPSYGPSMSSMKGYNLSRKYAGYSLYGKLGTNYSIYK